MEKFICGHPLLRKFILSTFFLIKIGTNPPPISQISHPLSQISRVGISPPNHISYHTNLYPLTEYTIWHPFTNWSIRAHQLVNSCSPIGQFAITDWPIREKELYIPSNGTIYVAPKYHISRYGIPYISLRNTIYLTGQKNRSGKMSDLLLLKARLSYTITSLHHFTIKPFHHSTLNTPLNRGCLWLLPYWLWSQVGLGWLWQGW